MNNKVIKKVFQLIRNGWKHYDNSAKQKAVDVLEYELNEIENIFGIIVLGSFIGFPSPPMQITLDLLPDMEKHFVGMLNKVDTAESPLSDLASILDVG